MKVSYAVLHWNRPYFALAHLQLAKIYFPYVSKFVLLDDGSDESLMGELKKSYSEVHVSNRNSNGWKSGNTSNLISKFCKETDADIVIFAEDDFLPCPTMFDDSSADEFLVCPDVIFPRSNINDQLVSNLSYIVDNNVYLQLGKSSYGWKKLSTLDQYNPFLEVNKEKDKREYSNWPWAMPSGLANKVFSNIPNLPIWQLENIANDSLASSGKHRNMCLRMKQYIHAGFICTTRLDSFDSIGKFNKNRKIGASKFSGNNVSSLNEIRDSLIRKYVDGKRININDLMSSGFHYALKQFIS